MIAAFKRLPGALQEIATTLRRACELLSSLLEHLDTDGSAEERLSALERSRTQWEAQVEAEILSSDSKYKQARAAEERARGMMQRAEKLQESVGELEEGEEDIPQEYLDLIRQSHGAGGEEEAVQSMPANVGRAPTRKDRAKAAKWGRF